MTGYSRSAFGPTWADVDHNGCDTRDDVLAAQLRSVQKLDACRVASGTEVDPYTGVTLNYVRGHSTVDIDHVVSLGDAWQKGAQQLSAVVREQFANDPLGLLAVSASANRQKGDGDAATWLPKAKSYRCAYVARQVAVKVKYHLWVTAAEKDAIGRVLSACPAQKLPSSAAGRGAVPTKPAPTSSSPRPKPSSSVPARPSSSKPPDQGVVHPGAFCAPAGATGHTAKGTPMVCGPASDGRNRWHQA